MAGRDEEEEEEEKSPVGCGRKCPRRWKDSEDSVLEMDDLLPVGGGGGEERTRSEREEKERKKREADLMRGPSTDLEAEEEAGWEYRFWGGVPGARLTGGPPGRGSCC